MASDAPVATAKISSPQHFMHSSGETDPIWVRQLKRNISAPIASPSAFRKAPSKMPSLGQADTVAPLKELEDWTRSRVPQTTTIDHKWNGQVFESVDYMAFIGKNQGQKHVYIVTGDSGNGLIHGVLVGKLIADSITEQPNPWISLYFASIAKSAAIMYKRFAQSDIKDIEDLVPGEGGVLNTNPCKPFAVYQEEGGQIHQFSALCPYMKGIVCWNKTGKSWGCLVHSSRFSKDGVQVCGPAKMGLQPADESGQAQQQQATKG
ncbi:fad dependent oxidoreductase [Stemphylium lycopersici]|uniref:Fad dependent oxidoreductase n=1 Tax=Stemphylium lycopersici TaxID=183478 RepID=A0A364MZH1_STELY|nr:fad dependent oxidoreductase [Stemphylium lycopersici]